MIAQELLPSQAPYTILDYGVSAIVLIVMGIVLWFTFKTLAKIAADHDQAMKSLVETMRVMQEHLLSLLVEARYSNQTSQDVKQALEMEQAAEHGRREESSFRHREERDHRNE